MLKTIKNEFGNWIEGEDGRAFEAVNFFQKQFTQKEQVDWNILSCIPKKVTYEDNDYLTSLPTLEEINKDEVFILIGSQGGLDKNPKLRPQCFHLLAYERKDLGMAGHNGGKILP